MVPAVMKPAIQSRGEDDDCHRRGCEKADRGASFTSDHNKLKSHSHRLMFLLHFLHLSPLVVVAAAVAAVVIVDVR